ncbi:MAG: hydroxyacid dehydrogenase [Rhizobiaceae bacterium]|nr:hydroxyacid dehydrogenase [Rhizobiaceae bacterium]
MPHVLVAGSIHGSGIELLDTAEGFTYDYVEEITEASYAPLVPRADALVVRTQPVSAATLATAGRLRIVSRHGVGYDAVDLAALHRRGIVLTIVGDVNSLSVAEHAMMMLLAAAKRAIRADGAVRRHGWLWRNRLEAGEISGKRLLILGYGRIGRHLARMASGFAMEVRAYDPYLAAAGWPEGPVAAVASLTEGLAWADAVSIHMPKPDRMLIGAAELAVMKPTAILINTARGGIVDEHALAEALAAGRLAGAGIDVFEDEPPVAESPLLGLDQVVLSPHTAGLTAESGERMAIASVRNVLDFFEGRLDPALIVDTGPR